MPVGYNRVPKDGLKHYRKFYTDELENVKEVMPNKPFLEEQIFRMNKESAGLFGGGSNDSKDNVSVDAGKFKGLVKVYRKELRDARMKKIEDGFNMLETSIGEAYEAQLNEKMDFDWNLLNDPKNVECYGELRNYLKKAGLDKLKIHEYMANYNFAKQLSERLKTLVKCKARIYILEGFNFAQKDLFSPSDPFLIVKCGDAVFSERENYQLDTSEPTFYKSYDFNVDFPGAPQLIIEGYDYDGFFGDDLIGITKIDLDDRFFNKEWCAIQNKPIEYRDIFHPTSTVSQGVVKLWVEVNPATSKKSLEDAIDISAEPVKLYEMRLIIWKCKDVPAMDFEGVSDVFVKSFLDPDDEYLTDTHWRLQVDKEGSFNWRNKIKLKSLQESYILNIQAWDKDIIASNDLIGDFQLDIGPLVEDVFLTNKMKVFNKTYWNEYMKKELVENRDYEFAEEIEWEKGDDTLEKFWVPMKSLNED